MRTLPNLFENFMDEENQDAFSSKKILSPLTRPLWPAPSHDLMPRAYHLWRSSERQRFLIIYLFIFISTQKNDNV